MFKVIAAEYDNFAGPPPVRTVLSNLHSPLHLSIDDRPQYVSALLEKPGLRDSAICETPPSPIYCLTSIHVDRKFRIVRNLAIHGYQCIVDGPVTASPVSFRAQGNSGDRRCMGSATLSERGSSIISLLGVGPEERIQKGRNRNMVSSAAARRGPSALVTRCSERKVASRRASHHFCTTTKPSCLAV